MVPAFASGNEEHKDEIWLMLLEKAFAKILGSYAALEQGKVTWALRTLTGDEVFVFQHVSGMWHRWDLDYASGPRGNMKQHETEKWDMERFSTSLRVYDERAGIIACSGARSSAAFKGLYSGHAYALLSIVNAEGSGGEIIRCVQGPLFWTRLRSSIHCERRGERRRDHPLRSRASILDTLTLFYPL